MRKIVCLHNVANPSKNSILHNKRIKEHVKPQGKTDMGVTYAKYVELLRFKYCSQTSMSLSVGWIEPFGWVELPTPKPEKVTTLVGSQSCKALKDVKDVCF